jgi:predicted ribosome quality control (RQC) complex YloA/Tae2 family protein
MPLDAVFLTALSAELEGRVMGLKIDKVQQPERDQILLTLRGPGKSERLLISAGTGDARVHLTDASFENPASPPMFCMLRRKHISGARIKSLTQPHLERAVDIALESIDQLGEPGEKHLIVELMGRYSNIILTDADGRIADCLRRVDTIMSERRQVLPGLFYRLPPAQDKRGLTETPREEFLSLLRSAPPDRPIDKWLVETFAALSPLVARELASRATGETDSRTGEILARDGGAGLAESFTALTSDIKAHNFAPYLLKKPDGKPFDFSFMPINQYGGAMALERAEDFSALLETFYTRRFASERMRQRSMALNKMARLAHDRIARKLGFQRQDLEKSQNASACANSATSSPPTCIGWKRGCPSSGRGFLCRNGRGDGHTA